MKVALKDVCSFISGNAWSAGKFHDSKPGMPIIRIQNLGDNVNGRFVYWRNEYDEKFIVCKDDVLISLSGSIKVDIWKQEPALLNQRILKIIPSERITKLYLLHQLQFVIKEIEQKGRHALVNNVSVKDIESYVIPLPDLKTQQEIAQVLEQADKARQQRKASNALTDQFLQSSFLSLFGDPVKNEKGWEVKTIGESDCKVQIGPFGTQLHAEDYIQGGIPLINPKHIQSMKVVEDNDLTVSKEKYAELPNYHLQVGDIIMARRGEMARCALITDRENGWFCGTGSLYIRPSKEFDSTYLLYVLSSASIKERLENDAQGVTMANLNQTIINNLTLAIPPLSLQQQFAAIVAQAETLRKKQQENEQELEQLFQSLLQKYFG